MKMETRMSELLTLVDNILVPHTAFKEGLRRIGQCFAYAQNGAQEPVCIAVIGESRTGKSRCAETFMRRHPTVRRDDGMHVQYGHRSRWHLSLK